MSYVCNIIVCLVKHSYMSWIESQMQVSSLVFGWPSLISSPSMKLKYWFIACKLPKHGTLNATNCCIAFRRSYIRWFSICCVQFDWVFNGCARQQRKACFPAYLYTLTYLHASSTLSNNYLIENMAVGPNLLLAEPCKVYESNAICTTSQSYQTTRWYHLTTLA